MPARLARRAKLARHPKPGRHRRFPSRWIKMECDILNKQYSPKKAALSQARGGTRTLQSPDASDPDSPDWLWTIFAATFSI